MDFNYEVSVYLTKMSSAALALGNMTDCGLEIDSVRRVIMSLLTLEQTTADFIADMKIAPTAAKPCRNSFIHANDTVIKRIEKIQLQSNNFDELSTALKLENGTLKEEINLL